MWVHCGRHWHVSTIATHGSALGPVSLTLRDVTASLGKVWEQAWRKITNLLTLFAVWFLINRWQWLLRLGPLNRNHWIETRVFAAFLIFCQFCHLLNAQQNHLERETPALGYVSCLLLTFYCSLGSSCNSQICSWNASCYYYHTAPTVGL